MVTKLFEGEDPPIATSIEVKEPPLAHSVGPESRVTGKATRPDMSHVPAPAFRLRHKAPGPGTVSIASKLYDPSDLAQEDCEAHRLACEDPFDMPSAMEFLCASTYVCEQAWTEDDGSDDYRAQHHLFGAYSREGKLEASRYCVLRPGMRQLLTKIAKTSCPKLPFTTVVLGANTSTYPSGQSQPGPGIERHVVVIRPPNPGGQIWVQLKRGMQVQGEAVIVRRDDQVVAGQCMTSNDVVTLPGGTMCGTQSCPNNSNSESPSA